MRITFFDYKKDNERLRELNESLLTDKMRLREEVADLALKKKVSEEDIEHMIKMKMEKNELELQKKVVKLEADQATASQRKTDR